MTNVKFSNCLIAIAPVLVLLVWWFNPFGGGGFEIQKRIPSPDGKLVAVASWDSNQKIPKSVHLKVEDLAVGKTVWEMKVELTGKQQELGVEEFLKGIQWLEGELKIRNEGAYQQKVRFD